MKVKIGNTIFDSKLEPIMIILSSSDKYNIANMDVSDKKYCCYPENISWEQIKEFMKNDN